MSDVPKKRLGVLRVVSRAQAEAPRNDDAYLRSSKTNESRLNAAITELNDTRRARRNRAS